MAACTPARSVALPDRRWVPAAVLLALGLAWPARAQDGVLAGVETEGEEFELAGPQNLPGRERGERPQPEPEPDEAAIEPEARDWFGSRAYWEWSRATGDWAGGRTWLEERGVTFAGSYTLDWSSVWEGGVNNVASTRSLLDLNLTVKSKPLLGYDGGTLFLDYFSSDSRGGSLDAGDFQGISNIATDTNRDILAEIWYEQALFDGLLRAKLGKIEANNEFGYLLSSGEFLNSSAGIQPTNAPFATYPDPAFGGVLFVYPHPQVFLGAGAFDGGKAVDGVRTGNYGPDQLFDDEPSDDVIVNAEAGGTWSFGGNRHGRAALGGWYHTGDFNRFDASGTEDGTFGVYLLAEQRVWSPEPDDDASKRGLSLFLQLGFADEDVLAAALHVGAGLEYRGVCDWRPSDVTGAYVSFVDLSDEAGFAEDETVLEAFYRFQLTPFASIKPDIQYIINPGGASDVDDAVVGAVRFEVFF